MIRPPLKHIQRRLDTQATASLDIPNTVNVWRGVFGVFGVFGVVVNRGVPSVEGTSLGLSPSNK
jgi:hypothetical protein